MNKSRREGLQMARQLLEQARGMIEIIKDAEQDAFDNLPESLQQTERGEAMECYIAAMEEVCDGIADIGDTIGEIVGG